MRLLRFSYLLPLLMVCLVVASGCQDKGSMIGSPYYPDSVQFRTIVKQDSNVIQLSPRVVSTFNALGTKYNITASSPVLLIGRSRLGTDNIESWGVLRFPALLGDSAQHLTAVKLLLYDVNYKYGDTTNSNVDLNVYNIEGNDQISDSTTSIPSFVLGQTPIGSIVNPSFADSTNSVLSIDITPSVYPDLTAASFTYIVAPGPSMTNVRGFGSKELTDTTGNPRIAYTFNYGSTVTTEFVRPTFDLHVVQDQSVTPPTEFTLRGSTSKREAVQLNFTVPGDSITLDQFSTINNAQLILKLDPANSMQSNQAFDTAGPVIVEITGTTDTSAVYYGNGIRDAVDPTIYRFQVRTLIEYWLRNPDQNFGFELRAGYSGRTFLTSAVGVEDNTLNRWTFYGSDAVDPNNRPKLTLSYSKLQ